LWNWWQTIRCINACGAVVRLAIACGSRLVREFAVHTPVGAMRRFVCTLANGSNEPPLMVGSPSRASRDDILPRSMKVFEMN